MVTRWIDNKAAPNEGVMVIAEFPCGEYRIGTATSVNSEFAEFIGGGAKGHGKRPWLDVVRWLPFRVITSTLK